ncbi:MAG: hypothetical protein CMF69_02350 [Magnetovibrio sp.]|nr:hypothetical protein [Magnetovibrio sp.]|tara:strand:+ start:108 stop:551 length:444 start_codon:yes stop_codon:yes gene_type:complete
MAQLPTVYAPTIAQVSAAAKSVSSSKSYASPRVASLDGRVEETSTGLPTSNLDMAPFALERELDQQHSHDHQQHQAPNLFELFLVSSESFTFLLDQVDFYRFNSNILDHNRRPSGNITSNAIKIYELNAKVIHGEPEVPGTTISLTL